MDYNLIVFDLWSEQNVWQKDVRMEERTLGRTTPNLNPSTYTVSTSNTLSSLKRRKASIVIVTCLQEIISIIILNLF